MKEGWRSLLFALGMSGSLENKTEVSQTPHAQTENERKTHTENRELSEIEQEAITWNAEEVKKIEKHLDSLPAEHQAYYTEQKQLTKEKIESLIAQDELDASAVKHATGFEQDAEFITTHNINNPDTRKTLLVLRSMRVEMALRAISQNIKDAQTCSELILEVAAANVPRDLSIDSAVQHMGFKFNLNAEQRNLVSEAMNKTKDIAWFFNEEEGESPINTNDVHHMEMVFGGSVFHIAGCDLATFAIRSPIKVEEKGKEHVLSLMNYGYGCEANLNEIHLNENAPTLSDLPTLQITESNRSPQSPENEIQIPSEETSNYWIGNTHKEPSSPEQANMRTRIHQETAQEASREKIAQAKARVLAYVLSASMLPHINTGKQPFRLNENGSVNFSNDIGGVQRWEEVPVNDKLSRYERAVLVEQLNDNYQPPAAQRNTKPQEENQQVVPAEGVGASIRERVTLQQLQKEDTESQIDNDPGPVKKLHPSGMYPPNIEVRDTQSGGKHVKIIMKN